MENIIDRQNDDICGLYMDCKDLGDQNKILSDKLDISDKKICDLKKQETYVANFL